MSENLEHKRSHHNRSVFFPLLIIFIGVVLLLSNFGVIPGGWSLLIRFWPIFFIFGGLDDLVNHKWTGAVFNVGLGTILILANFGFFSMSTWQIILNFWPVLIIALGMEIIFKGRSIIGSVIGVSFSFLVLFGIVWFALQGPMAKEAISVPISYELNEVEEVDLYLHPLVANMSVEASKISKQAIEGEVFTANNEKLSKSSVINGNTQQIKLSTDGNVILPSKNMSNGFPWNLQLNSQIPFVLEIEQIFGVQKLSLQDMNLVRLDSQVVMGSMEVYLPDDLEKGGKLETVIGEMVLFVPKDTAIQIKIDSGITSVFLEEGFVREGDFIYSETAKRNEQDQLLFVNLPIGSLQIKNP